MGSKQKAGTRVLSSGQLLLLLLLKVKYWAGWTNNVFLIFVIITIFRFLCVCWKRHVPVTAEVSKLIITSIKCGSEASFCYDDHHLLGLYWDQVLVCRNWKNKIKADVEEREETSERKGEWDGSGKLEKVDLKANGVIGTQEFIFRKQR